MKSSLTVIFSSLLLIAGYSPTASAAGPADWLECDFRVPKLNAPYIATGVTATAEQMAETQAAVSNYVGKVVEYLDGDCAWNNRSYKKLLSRAEDIAGAYNRELQSYRISLELIRSDRVTEAG